VFGFGVPLQIVGNRPAGPRELTLWSVRDGRIEMFLNCHEVSLRKWLALVGLCCVAVPACADWFTVRGDPFSPGADTVQVDPVAMKSDGGSTTMRLRVNRARLRNNWEGQPYRSYDARVAFDCRAMKADYLYVAYYMQPLWQGEPYLRTDYSDNRRRMLFKDMEPNPTARIIRAACRPGGE